MIQNASVFYASRDLRNFEHRGCYTVANDHRGMEIDIVVKGSEPLHTPFRLDLRRHLLEGTVTGLVPSGQIDDIWTF